MSDDRILAATPGGTQDRFYASPGIARLPMIVRARGLTMWDTDGRGYLDASSGPMVSCLGHCHPRLVEAMTAQARTLDYAFSLVARNPRNAELAARLARMAGPGFERVTFTSGGSEAMERALQFARHYRVATGEPQRRAILVLEPSYHGGTIATAAIGGDQSASPVHGGFAVTAHAVPAPMPYRRPAGLSAAEHAAGSIVALERRIAELGPETVLAFVMEPVGGVSRGADVPDAGFLARVREICSRHGILMIFDEIVTGCGRTGPFFAMEHWPAARPDLLVIAKGLGAGHAPIGAVLAPAVMVDRLAAAGGFEYAFSYNANPIASAVASAVLDEIEEGGLLAAGRARGDQLGAGLAALAARHPIVGDVRGLGLYRAVELVADRGTKAMLPQAWRPLDRLRNLALERGLMVYARATSGGRYGHWFTLAPPLTVTAAEIDRILDRLDATLDDFAAAARADGLVAG